MIGPSIYLFIDSLEQAIKSIQHALLVAVVKLSVTVDVIVPHPGFRTSVVITEKLSFAFRSIHSGVILYFKKGAKTMLEHIVFHCYKYVFYYIFILNRYLSIRNIGK